MAGRQGHPGQWPGVTNQPQPQPQQPQQQQQAPWQSAAPGSNGVWQSAAPRHQQQQRPQQQQQVRPQSHQQPTQLGFQQQQQQQQQQQLNAFNQAQVPPHSIPNPAAGNSALYQTNQQAFNPQHDRQHSQQQQQFTSTAFNGAPQGWQSHVSPAVLTPSYEHGQFNFAPQPQPGQATQPQLHPNQTAQAARQQRSTSSQQPQQPPNPLGSYSTGFKAEDDDEARRTGGLNAQGQKTGTSDFVKKLFTMLDDLSYASIVSWSQAGDSFVVRNMNDFTKHILPRHFRHSNFASFVRQLNKYDFHKVKNPEEQATQPADQIWEFKHPDFIRGREDLLENVRRKMPSGKKKAGDDRDNSPSMLNPSEAAEKGAEEYQQLKDQIATLTATQDQMSSHINNLTKQYQGVIGEMLTFQRNMVQQDQLMQNLIQYLMNLENDRKIETSSSANSHPSLSDGPFVSSDDAQKLIGSYEDVARASFGQMSEIAQRTNQRSGREHSAGAQHGPSPASFIGGSSATPGTASIGHGRPSEGNLSPKSFGTALSPATLPPDATLPPSAASQATSNTLRSSPSKPDEPNLFLHPPHIDDDDSNTLFNTAANMVDNPSLAGFEGAGLKVFTVGTLQPRDGSSQDAGLSASTLAAAFGKAAGETDGGKQQNFGISVPSLESLPGNMLKLDKRTTSTNPTPNPHTESPDENGSRDGTPSEGGSNLLRVRRSTYVPGWAVPPRVLLVDDDAVCRKLSSKFLQVFGCAIDVAVDGVNAVNKMNLEQYDLVLMDIVMPNLDGVSATSLIREFDPRTPIISMTSNSAPQELINYMSSGMNDILPKPFTKEGLLNVLEKHLIHLKTVQKMDQIPKQLGLPPVSKETLQGVLSATAASASALDLPLGALSSPSGKALPAAAMMGNGPGVNKLEEVPNVSSGSGGTKTTATEPTSPSSTVDGQEDPTTVNPLSNMGFSDEEYISMVQSLIAAGSVSGDMSDTVSGVMGVQRGEGASGASNGRSQDGADDLSAGLGGGSGAGRKRGADISPARDDDLNDNKKKQRGADFGELPSFAT